MTRPLRPGDRLVTPTVEITEQMRGEVVRIGGFTHPLFVRPPAGRAPPGPAAGGPAGVAPLPGQAVLLLMGGLVEQTGRFADAIALTGMREVRFLRPVVAGDHLHVTVEVVAARPHSAGRQVREMRWAAVNQAGQTAVEATVALLVRSAPEDPGADLTDGPAATPAATPNGGAGVR